MRSRVGGGRRRGAPEVGLLLAAVLALTGCAGSAGGATAAGPAGGGYEANASDEEIRAAFEDVDPVTIKFQPSAASAESIDAYPAQAFVSRLEDLSGGKITVETTYGQAIAGYPEIADALVDGRLDVAYMLPIYEPKQYPVFAGYVTASTLSGTSPLVDELAANAAMSELAWQDEKLIAEFEDQGLTPLNPFNAAGSVMTMCSDSVATAGDWKGKQVRISSAAQTAQVEGLGSSSTSLEYTEVFEAMQRGSVDCTLSATLPAVASGFLEVAPHVMYNSDVTFARGAGALVAGSSFGGYPLAVQQLVFDTLEDEFMQTRRRDLEGNLEATELAAEHGGAFHAIDEDSEAALKEESQGLVQNEVAAGTLPESIDADMEAAMDHWRSTAKDLGFEDEGGFETYAEWYVQDEEHLRPFAEAFYNEVLLPRRPS